MSGRRFPIFQMKPQRSDRNRESSLPAQQHCKFSQCREDNILLKYSDCSLKILSAVVGMALSLFPPCSSRAVRLSSGSDRLIIAGWTIIVQQLDREANSAVQDYHPPVDTVMSRVYRDNKILTKNCRWELRREKLGIPKSRSFDRKTDCLASIPSGHAGTTRLRYRLRRHRNITRSSCFSLRFFLFYTCTYI